MPTLAHYIRIDPIPKPGEYFDRPFRVELGIGRVGDHQYAAGWANDRHRHLSKTTMGPLPGPRVLALFLETRALILSRQDAIPGIG